MRFRINRIKLPSLLPTSPPLQLAPHVYVAVGGATQFEGNRGADTFLGVILVLAMLFGVPANMLSLFYFSCKQV